MSLDPSKLIGAKTAGGKTVCQCPACAAIGQDLKGKNHLLIHASGAYGCVVDRSEEHSKAIYALAGVNGTGIVIDYTGPIEQPKIEVEKTWPVSVLDRLLKDHSYWVNRGVREEVLPPLRGGIATDGQMKGRYVFPIFNTEDQIIGFAGRALDPKVEMRWKHMGAVSSWVWADLDAIEEAGHVILVEGAGCRLALDSRGHGFSIPLWGVNLSEAILGALIAANPKRITVATNNDQKHAVGQRAAAKIKATLDRFFDPGVAAIGLPIAKDFLDQDEEQWVKWETTVLNPADPAADTDEDAEPRRNPLTD